MSKMIKIDTLREVLKDIIPVDENGTKALEAITEKAEDIDEEAVNTKIAEASAKAKEEAQAEYAQKLHDAFFNPAGVKSDEVAGADQQNHNEPEKVEPVNIFDIVE